MRYADSSCDRVVLRQTLTKRKNNEFDARVRIGNRMGCVSGECMADTMTFAVLAALGITSSEQSAVPSSGGEKRP